MPSVSTRLRNTIAANAWIKRDRRTSNKERERTFRTITNKRRIKRRMEEEDKVMSKRKGMRRTRRMAGRRRWEAWEEGEEKEEGGGLGRGPRRAEGTIITQLGLPTMRTLPRLGEHQGLPTSETLPRLGS